MSNSSNKKTGPKLGFKRKSIPGYFLGVDKLGRHTWKASKKIEKIYSRDEFFEKGVPSGTVISLNRSTNVVVIAVVKNRAIVYNPVNQTISHTAFGRAKTVIVRGHTEKDFFKKEKILNKKVLGMDAKVSDLLGLENKFDKIEPGEQLALRKYRECARVGDVLKNKAGHNLKTIALSKKYIVFENQETSQHGAINIDKDENEYVLGGDNKLDIVRKTLQSSLTDKCYVGVKLSTGGRVIKAKQVNPKELEIGTNGKKDNEQNDVFFEKTSIVSKSLDGVQTARQNSFIEQIKELPIVDNNRRIDIIEKGVRLSNFIKKAESNGISFSDAIFEFYNSVDA